MTVTWVNIGLGILNSFTLVMFGLVNRGIIKQLRVTKKDLSAAQDLISEETQRKIAHREAFEDLIDPAKIDAELERSARRHEAWNANRSSVPREDSGPPAVIHAPKKLRSGGTKPLVIPFKGRKK